MHISTLISGFSRWTLGVFGRPYWVVVGKYYLTHISKGITGFSRYTPGVFGRPYWVVVGKYYLMHISTQISGFSRWTLGVFGRPYWVVVGKYYLTHISKLITGFSRCTPGVFGRPYWVVVGKYYLMHISTLRCVYTHINSDQRVYLMVSRAKPGEIASSPILFGNGCVSGMVKREAEGLAFRLQNCKTRSVLQFCQRGK